MLRLSDQLFRIEPEAHYVDFYERALFNHILASQHPESGGMSYLTPTAPASRRSYSRAPAGMTCCVGTGMQNHGKHARLIYAAAGNVLYVNLFIASELSWKERGVKLRQETEFPDKPRTRLVVSLESPTTFVLRLRYPGWVAAGELKVAVNGEALPIESAPSSYVSVEREWKDGDRVEIDLPMHTRLERLPDGSDFASIVHGPIVLAASLDAADPLAEFAEGRLPGQGGARRTVIQPADAPRLTGSDEVILAGIEPVADRPLTFTARRVVRPVTYRELELIPFSRLHDARYMIYWPIGKTSE
jgi:DUF1680 family protein